MIEVSITQEMRDLATEKSASLGVLNNSITHGDGNFFGFLGEMVANEIIHGIIDETFDYDIITLTGVTYDVKSKRCTSKPKPYYECSVADFNTSQKCDHYAFVRVLNNAQIGWYLGSIPKSEFYTKAKFMKRGQRDRDNNFTFKADCYNIRISELCHN